MILVVFFLTEKGRGILIKNETKETKETKGGHMILVVNPTYKLHMDVSNLLINIIISM